MTRWLMRTHRVVLLLIVLVGSSSSAQAGFAPSFYLDGCVWDASHPAGRQPGQS